MEVGQVHLDGGLQPSPRLCKKLPVRCKWVEDCKPIRVASHQWAADVVAATVADVAVGRLIELIR